MIPAELRRMLELAAKAYFQQDIADGVCSFRWDEKEDAIVYIHGENEDYNGNDVELLWNPADDDGDSRRLEVTLGIKVMPYPIYALPKHSVIASRRILAAPEDDEKTYNGPEVLEPYGDDPRAATRLAVLRAAAAIGEKMS